MMRGELFEIHHPSSCGPTPSADAGLFKKLGTAGCVALYYVLFAAMTGSVQTILLESVVMTLFATAAVVGFKSSAWIVVAALAGHGIFDALHGHVLENSGVPVWSPAFCLAYDLGAAASLAWLIKRHGHTR